MVASHVPVLLDPTRGPLGTLVGHFAKANEHAQAMNSPTLVVFTGPHAYISPTWYETPNTVPTWNYVAVHASGIMKPVEDIAALARILSQTVDKYEKSRPIPWQFDAQTEFHQKLMGAIIGFEIEITKIEGKWKLNQNHPVERRERVIAALGASDDVSSREVAQLMRETLR
jgi:transcriptional regulator